MTKYGVILADPPWQYRNTGVEGSAENEYRTMADSEIAALPVAELMATDSVLLLWATWPKLDIAMGVLDKWGVDYVTGLPWIKVENVARNLFDDGIEFKPFYGIGFWVRGCSEPILIGRKGKPVGPSFDYYGLLSPNVHHSRKPDDIYEYAESLPGPYLELFARRPRPGWDVWGNEVDSTIDFDKDGPDA